MKKIYLLLFLFFSIVLTNKTSAQIVELDSVTYSVYEGTAKVIGASYDVKFPVVPEFINYEGIDYPVDGIEGYSFSQSPEIIGIKLPNSIKYIGGGAFSGCSRLRGIEIPEACEYIGGYAFQNTNLKFVVMGENVSEIGSCAFENCHNLKAVYIPSLESWLDINFEDGWANPLNLNAFIAYSNYYDPNNEPSKDYTSPYWKVYITELVIPEGCEKIKKYAFYGGSGIKTIKFPETLTEIEEEAFGNNGLTSLFFGIIEDIYFPASLKKIGYNGIHSCQRMHVKDLMSWCSIELENYTNWNGEKWDLYLNDDLVKDLFLPEGLEVINPGIFYNCQLYSITIPSTLRSIGKSAFVNGYLQSFILSDLQSWCNVELEDEGANPLCTLQNSGTLWVNDEQIVSLKIPDGVTNVNDYVFHKAPIENITFSSSVQSIGEMSFSTTSLESVVIPENVIEIKRAAFESCSLLTSAEILSPIDSLPDYLFNLCALTNVILPETVTKIGECAFQSNKFSEFNFHENITYIGDYAFNNCANLKNLELPESLEYIGNAAFRGCPLIEQVSIPKNVTFIGYGAFWNYAGTSVDCFAPNPPEVGHMYSLPGCFKTPETMVLHVPEGTKDLYEAAYHWKEFGEIIDDLPNDQSSVNQITFDELNEDQPIEVFTLNGIKLNNIKSIRDISTANPGLYIVRQGKKTYRIIK